jgi:hypothetical protein
MDLVTVASYQNPGQACLARTLLEDAGIPCALADESDAGLTPFFSRQRGGVKLKVPADSADEARALLADVAGDLPHDAA